MRFVSCGRPKIAIRVITELRNTEWGWREPCWEKGAGVAVIPGVDPVRWMNSAYSHGTSRNSLTFC